MVEPESSTHSASMANANESSRNSSDDSSSVYYLHPLDNPGALLVSEILTGANYIAWSRSISIALTVKNKITFIDEKEIHGSLLYFTAACDVWEELKTRCGILDRCSCNLLKIFTDRQQSDYVMKFLIGLHDSYSMMRSQLLLQSPLPSMSKVFSLLLQEENQRSLSNAVGFSMDSYAMIAAQTQKSVITNGTHFTKSKARGNIICSHCGYTGHLADKCFHLIGFPPGWKGPRGKKIITPQNGNTNTNLSNANVASSLEFNSSISNIFSQEQIQNLLSLANGLSNTNVTPIANTVSTSGIISCHVVSADKNSSPWILDTGATDHMICSPHFFTSIHLPKQPFAVHLPNGQSAPVIFTGTVHFSADIILHNALYIPSFSVNLISASKLTKENSIGLHFLQSKCILQNLISWKMIAEVKSGLYHLQQSPVIARDKSDLKYKSSVSSANNCTINADIWHFRLGHIPSTIMKFINAINSNVSANPIHTCEVCPLAK
ncbi:uncharacterized protein LOC131151433 [Malania oleifera]|uniref:uncharacterized protein LOC131151433 n=1 Tax=Malania oleifera TaxID=397392 RepID=UPI0025AE2F04|nr:uncharacterized protein LOC131151433 [Malania oleifera]